MSHWPALKASVTHVTLLVFFSFSMLQAGPPGFPLTKVTRKSDLPSTLEGRAILEDTEGGMLLEDRLGVYWTIPANQVVRRVSDASEYQRSDSRGLETELTPLLGEQSHVVRTPHYILISNTGPIYTEWCGSLFERLYHAFYGYWDRAQIPLSSPESPLPVLIFRDRQQFADYAVQDGAIAVAGSDGYYSARTNRVVLFDFTSERGRAAGDFQTKADLLRRLEDLRPNITTCVHEAVHQLAFNSGLQKRYADNPVWLTEGLAMYFEAPDLRSATGWSGLGKANPLRLQQFRSGLPSRAEDSLQTLIQSDNRFRTPEEILPAYSESWALVHYLATTKRGRLVEYLKTLRQRPPLEMLTPEERLTEFRQHFGQDLGQFDRQFLDFISRRSGAPGR